MAIDRFSSPQIKAGVKQLFTNKTPVRALVIPDFHIPQHDRRATDLMLNFARHEKEEGRGFDTYIQIGDFMNLKILSKHENWNKVSFEGLRLQRDFDTANGVLDELDEIVGDKHPRFILEGNHDHRLTKYLAEHPELIDSGLTIPEKLHFDERKVIWVPNWSLGTVLQIGNATYVHGSIIRKFHAAGMMDKFQTNVFYGHVHDNQKFSAVTAGEAKARVAESLCCLQDPADYWEQFNGNRWQLGFADFTFFPDGGFGYNVYQIHNNRAAIGGRVFKPKGIC